MSEPASAPDARNARCARCGGGFHCGVHDAQPCACATLSLSPALLARLRQDYRGCLCLGCLQSLARADAGAQADAGTGRTHDPGTLFRAL